MSRAEKYIMGDTDEFLEQLRGVGRLHSQGLFTVNPLHEFSGLNLYHHGSDALLGLVQAAVASRSTRLDFKLRVGSVEVAFDPAEPLTASALVHQLANPVGRWRHLAFPLRGALEAGFPLIWYQAWEEQALQGVVLTRHGIQESALEKRSHLRGNGVRITLIRSGGFSLSGLWARAREHRALGHRCRFAPLALRVGTRLINDPRVQGAAIETVVRAPLGPGILAGATPALRFTYGLCAVDQGDFVQGPYYHSSPDRCGRPLAFHTVSEGLPPAELEGVGPFRPGDPTARKASLQACRAVLGFLPRWARPAVLTPVVFGVCLDPHEVPEAGTDILAFLAADRLTTDLTGLRVVEDDKLKELQEPMKAYSQAMMTALRRSEFRAAVTDDLALQQVRRPKRARGRRRSLRTMRTRKE